MFLPPMFQTLFTKAMLVVHLLLWPIKVKEYPNFIVSYFQKSFLCLKIVILSWCGFEKKYAFELNKSPIEVCCVAIKSSEICTQYFFFLLSFCYRTILLCVIFYWSCGVCHMTFYTFLRLWWVSRGWDLPSPTLFFFLLVDLLFENSEA